MTKVSGRPMADIVCFVLNLLLPRLIAVVKMAIFSSLEKCFEKGAPLWGQKSFSSNFLPKRSLGIEGLQQIKFHYPTLKPDFNKVCVNVNSYLINFIILTWRIRF